MLHRDLIGHGSRAANQGPLERAGIAGRELARGVRDTLVQRFRAEKGVKGRVIRIREDFDGSKLAALLKRADANGVIIESPNGSVAHVRRETISYSLPGGGKGGGRAFAVSNGAFTEHIHNRELAARRLCG